MRGHQPFFVAAAVFAVLSIGGWLAILEGAADPSWSLPAASWHAHEMLFGYTVAVLAGFLLLGARGPRVGLLVAIWAAGRLVMAATWMIPAELVAAIDLSFAPALALLRTPTLWGSWKWPTTAFIPLLGATAVANLLWHLDAMGIASGGARAGELLMLDLLTLMMVVMAGRLIPGYTRAMLIPVRAPKDPVLERWSIAFALALAISDQTGWAVPAGVSAGVLGGLQAVRLSGWRTRDVLRRPLLLVLHAGFGWLAFGLLLRADAELGGWISPVDALHAITVGAIGLLTLGMMGRLARTHGRRPLAASRVDLASYGALLAAAFARALVPALVPAWRETSIAAAGALWIVAFLLFLAGHAKFLGRGPAAADRDHR